MSEQPIPPPVKKNGKPPPKKMSKGVAIAYGVIIIGSALAGYELYKKLKPGTTTTASTDPASTGYGYWSPGTTNDQTPYDYSGAGNGSTGASGTTGTTGGTDGGGGTIGSTGTGTGTTSTGTGTPTTTASFWSQLTSALNTAGYTVNPLPSGWTAPTSMSDIQTTTGGAGYYAGLNKVAYPSFTSSYLSQQPIITGAADVIKGMVGQLTGSTQPGPDILTATNGNILPNTGTQPYTPGPTLTGPTPVVSTGVRVYNNIQQTANGSYTTTPPTNNNFINRLIGGTGVGAILGGAIAGLYNLMGLGTPILASDVGTGAGAGLIGAGGGFTIPGSGVLGSVVEGASSLIGDVSSVFSGGAVLVQTPQQYTSSMQAIFGTQNPVVNAVTSGYSNLVGGISNLFGVSTTPTSQVSTLTPTLSTAGVSGSARSQGQASAVTTQSVGTPVSARSAGQAAAQTVYPSTPTVSSYASAPASPSVSSTPGYLGAAGYQGGTVFVK